MERYRNLSGNSGVTAFRVLDGAIEVAFGEWIYRYTNESAGEDNVDQMVQLARAGQGLSTFISQTVQERYASRRRQ